MVVGHNILKTKYSSVMSICLAPATPLHHPRLTISLFRPSSLFSRYIFFCMGKPFLATPLTVFFNVFSLSPVHTFASHLSLMVSLCARQIMKMLQMPAHSVPSSTVNAVIELHFLKSLNPIDPHYIFV